MGHLQGAPKNLTKRACLLLYQRNPEAGIDFVDDRMAVFFKPSSEKLRERGLVGSRCPARVTRRQRRADCRQRREGP